MLSLCRFLPLPGLDQYEVLAVEEGHWLKTHKYPFNKRVNCNCRTQLPTGKVTRWTSQEDMRNYADQSQSSVKRNQALALLKAAVARAAVKEDADLLSDDLQFDLQMDAMQASDQR